VDEDFYVSLHRFMDRFGAPAPARDVVAFRHGIATWNFAEASAAAERLLPYATQQHHWISADELRDGLVMANLHLGNATVARRYFDVLGKFSTRPPSDLRTLLLKSYVETAERQSTSAQR
jgi:hypothetical protein